MQKPRNEDLHDVSATVGRIETVSVMEAATVTTVNRARVMGDVCIRLGDATGVD